ncbi:trypsin-like peptidase domain-containing protein [Fulvivirga ulvae]|uniref:S1C family serine protease n=1 Tax=Fulvivirga ulvae TaxID=2904245 RepID=UPI001F3ECD8D|nr:trypsin-like peptidase domain-containing protein [Fulvivirga ulvae]UII31452.1 trypsin-like peptidase domain-containing protein [Fulvivirga ulvae]
MKHLILTAIIAIPGILNSQSLSDLYKKVSPSVVVIQTKEEIEHSDGQVSYMGSQGSGVLISSQGEILTAAHVVNNAEHITVIFHDGKKFPAKVIRLATVADVALIKLVYFDNQYPVAELGDSDLADVGDDVFIIGAPFGLEHSLSKGIISGKSIEKTRMEGFTFAEFFQTDAAINHGNSGGPMFNSKGEVIGLVSYIVSESGGFDGIGFAATINVTKQLVVDSDKRRWTGINGVLVDKELAKLLNVPQPGGILIQSVVALSPAFMANLKGGNVPLRIGDQEINIGGDIILEVNDIPIISEENIITFFKSTYLMEKEERNSFKLKILRAGKVQEVILQFAE